MPEPEITKSPFARYVSSVEGHLVGRYGSSTAQQSNALIGARRTQGSTPPVVWQTEEVIALTHAEWASYGLEYQRAINDGALRERTEADYAAQIKREREREAEYDRAQARQESREGE